MPDKTRTILIINEEGEQESQEGEVANILKKDGYRILNCQNCAEALKLLKQQTADLVLLDIKVVVKEGLDKWEAIRKIYPELPVVTVSFSGAYREF